MKREREQRALRVQPVFRLVVNHRLRTIDHRVRDFVAAGAGRQCMKIALGALAI